jgi:hypothetical protein
MSFQDPPRRQRPPRYPSGAQYQDGYPPHQDQQGYQGYQSYQGYQNYQSYQDTEAGYRDENGYADDYRGFTGLVGRPGAREQRPPWDDPADTRADWQSAPRRTSGPFLAASDGDYEMARDDEYRRPRHLADRGQGRSRGLLAGAVAGFLAAAVAIGVANLVAAFVRPQASPIIAVGGAFIDRTPPALKNFAVEKFGENDKNMLLLGMYVTIALIAIAIGILAWRRVAIGVAGIGLFGLFGAFVAITRPESHVTDVIPSIIGGIVGIATIVWLVRMGAAKPIGAAWTGRARGTRRGGVWAGGNA